jgi:bacterioferritin (cytochrome b1)
MTNEAIHLLNRLLAIHERSFVQYLAYARPYVPPGREDLLEALAAMDNDQDVMAARISHMIIDGGGLPRSGEFPMEFTDMHDLSVDFLLQAAVQYQRYDVEAIGEIVDRLTTEPAARSVAEEALGMAKGHLDTLRELASPKAAA